MIWDYLLGLITLGNILTALAYLIGLIVAKTGLDFLLEIRDVVEKVRLAKLPSSPGGDTINDEERNEIRAEALEALEVLWNRYKSTIFGWLGWLYDKISFWK